MPQREIGMAILNVSQDLAQPCLLGDAVKLTAIELRHIEQS